MPAPDSGFSVSYPRAKYQPATAQLKVIRNSGDLTTPASTTTDPNPVFAELQPAGRRQPRLPRRNPNAAPPPAGAASR